MSARRVVSVVLSALLLGAAPVGSQSAEAVHVVQPGETLWQIAAHLSGNPHRWPEIYRANRDQIKDPSTLYPGQRLAIPDFTQDAPRDGASRDAAPPGAD